jgi:hypothetical protein
MFYGVFCGLFIQPQHGHTIRVLMIPMENQENLVTLSLDSDINEPSVDVSPMFLFVSIPAYWCTTDSMVSSSISTSGVGETLKH